ncbi:MAG: MFS transporter [Chryseolinea sp.]
MLRHRIAVNIAFFVNGFVLANWASRLPRIQEIYQIDDGTIGLVLLALSIGAVIAMPFTGWVIIRNGSKKITIVSATAYCLIISLIPIVPSLYFLLAVFFLMGVSTGIMDVAMNAQAILVEQEYKRSIITSFHALFSIGMMLGASASAFVMEQGMQIAYHFWVVSGVAVAGVIWAAGNLVIDNPTPGVKSDGPLFRIPNRSLVSIGIIAFCCMISEGAVSDWSVNFMENVVHSKKAVAPLALSAFATAMTIGRLAGDKARNRFGDKLMIVGGGFMAITGTLLAVILTTEYGSIAGFFLVGIGLSTIIPIAYSIAGNEKGLPPGVGLAMVTTVGYSGFLIGPPLIGFIADAKSLHTAMIMVSGLLIIMTVIGLWYKPPATVNSK